MADHRISSTVASLGSALCKSVNMSLIRRQAIGHPSPPDLFLVAYLGMMHSDCPAVPSIQIPQLVHLNVTKSWLENKLAVPQKTCMASVECG